MEHLSEQEMSDFLEGRLAPAAVRRLVHHLLSRCWTCHRCLLSAGLPEPLFRERERPPEDAYDAAIDRARRKVRKLLPRLIQDGEKRDLGLKLLQEKGGIWSRLTWPEHRSFDGIIPHVEILLQRSIGHRHSNPRQMLMDAKSAQEVADRGEAKQYGETLLFDLRARAWAELGNARRVNEMYQEADAAFQQARRLLEQGTGDLSIQARIDDLEASLRMAQRRFDEALHLLDSVYRTQRRLGQEHLAVRALMSKGSCLGLAGRGRDAVQVYEQVLEQIDPENDLQLTVNARHNYLMALVVAERFVEAGDFLLSSGLRKSFAGEPLNEIRLRWVEARIMAGRGRLAGSERVFEDVRSGFREHKLHYDAALAGMDLAVVLLKQKKSAQALFREMSNEALAKGLHEEATLGLAAFDMIYRIKPQEITLRRVERLRQFLNDLQSQPRLTFVPELVFGMVH